MKYIVSFLALHLTLTYSYAQKTIGLSPTPWPWAKYVLVSNAPDAPRVGIKVRFNGYQRGDTVNLNIDTVSAGLSRSMGTRVAGYAIAAELVDDYGKVYLHVVFDHNDGKCPYCETSNTMLHFKAVVPRNNTLQFYWKSVSIIPYGTADIKSQAEMKVMTTEIHL